MRGYYHDEPPEAITPEQQAMRDATGLAYYTEFAASSEALRKDLEGGMTQITRRLTGPDLGGPDPVGYAWIIERGD